MTQLGVAITLMLIPLSVMAAGEQTLIAQVQLQDTLKPEFAVSITAPEGADRSAVANIILQMIAGSLIYAAGPIAVFMLAFGGLRYVTSHGDQNQIEEAKKTIMWAVIGLLVIVVSFAIVTSIIRILESVPKVGA